MLDALGHPVLDLVRRPVGACEHEPLGRPRGVLRIEIRELVTTTAGNDEEGDQQPE